MHSHRWGASPSKQKWVAGMPAAYTAVDRSPRLQKREEGGEPKKGGRAPHREKESLAWPFGLVFPFLSRRLSLPSVTVERSPPRSFCFPSSSGSAGALDQGNNPILLASGSILALPGPLGWWILQTSPGLARASVLTGRGEHTRKINILQVGCILDVRLPTKHLPKEPLRKSRCFSTRESPCASGDVV